MKIQTSIIAVILLLFITVCTAANLYVDASIGDNSNDGSSETQGEGTIGPWRTIQFAINHADTSETDTIHINRNIFT